MIDEIILKTILTVVSFCITGVLGFLVAQIKQYKKKEKEDKEERIDYIDALLEDYSIEFLVRCQKQKMFVVQTIKGCDPEQIFMQGAAEVEYLYDVKIRSFYQYLMSNMPVSPDMQLDVTDAVKSLGIESKVDTLKCSACLWVHYNKFPCYDKDQIKMYARSYYAKKNGVK